MKTTVIYHSADFDGIFCREIAKKFLGVDDVTYIGWDYKDPRLDFPSDGLVYVLDLSPECFNLTNNNLPLMSNGRFEGTYNRLIWIDHHKSSIDKFPTSIPGYRIDGVAACRLTYQWFTFQESNTLLHKGHYVDRLVMEPWAVRLAGEYDIWDRRDPNAELFQHGLGSQDLNDQDWEVLLGIDEYATSSFVSILLQQGRSLQYRQTKENASIIKAYGYTARWEGITWLVCNHARFNSFLFTAGLKPEHQACLGYNWTGKLWRVSLYHAPGHEDLDLSKLAVAYGGGHKGACGFTTNYMPEQLLQDCYML